MQDNENYCPKLVDTYSKFSIIFFETGAILICTSSDAKYPNGDLAHGGYSDGIRAHERFVFPIPDGVDLADAGTFVSTSCHCLDSVCLLFLAPMLCGGLTTFSPLVRNGCGTTAKKVAVVGIGGLYVYFFFLIYACPDQYLQQRPLCFNVGQSTRRRSLRLFALRF